MINPSTSIYLCDVPIENDNKNQITFANANAQYNYFSSKIVRTFDNYTYQRKDETIVVNAKVDDIRMCNYLFYKNNNFTNKWYYCFINKVEYVSEGSTRIFIETDVFQTWQFDIVYRNSFVEREHVNDDIAGNHTIPEGVELGDYVVDNKNYSHSLLFKGFIIASTIDLNDDGLKNVNGDYYNGVYSGYKYFYFASETQAKNILNKVADAGKSDGIQAIFMVPTNWLETGTQLYPEVESSMSSTNHKWSEIFGSGDTNNYKPTSLNGYTPKNKKLLTYPYCYLLGSNNSGGSAIYKYELFNNPTNNLIDFDIKSAITPGMSIRLVPLYYNGVDENNEEGLNLGKFPICSWNTDVFTNWLTQNGVNIGISLASSALQIAGGAGAALTGAGAGLGASQMLSGVLGVSNSLGQIYQHSLQPAQAEGNINSGDVTFASSNLTFTLYQMSIKSEYARVIDEYFNMYGYKVNRVKTPNITGRRNWNYVKTIDCNFTGNIPQDDMLLIKTLFNNGITLWHNPATFLDYSQNNDII